MASNYPPDGWSMGVVGTWGTDIDREEYTTLVPETGAYSLKWKSTALADLVSDKKHVEADRPYRADFVARSSAATGSDTFDAAIYWYQADGTTLDGTSSIWSSFLTPATTWLHKTSFVSASSTARMAKLILKKTTNNATDFWVDRFTIQRTGFAFEATRAAGAQTFTTGAYTTATFDTEARDHGAWFVHTTGIGTVKEAGMYAFSGTLALPNLDDGEIVRLALQVNGATRYQGGEASSSLADQTRRAHLAVAATYLDVGDTVNLGIIHNEGANQTQTLETGAAWFTGIQLPPFGFG